MLKYSIINYNNNNNYSGIDTKYSIIIIVDIPVPTLIPMF